MKALWCGAAALIDEAGPTASHGGSFVHQGQFPIPVNTRRSSISPRQPDSPRPRTGSSNPSSYSESIRVKATCDLAEPNLVVMRSGHCWCGKQVSSTGGPTGAKGPSASHD